MNFAVCQIQQYVPPHPHAAWSQPISENSMYEIIMTVFIVWNNAEMPAAKIEFSLGLSTSWDSCQDTGAVIASGLHGSDIAGNSKIALTHFVCKARKG